MIDFARLVDRLAAHEPFAFSRWGDGEWSAILGLEGATVDGQAYTPALREDLSAVLIDRPAYLLGMQGFAQRRFGPEIEAWLAMRHLVFPWVDADLFARASIDDELDRFFHALKRRAVILVAPAHLAGVARLVPVARHVPVPRRNAHAAIASILRETIRAIRELAKPVLAISAGPAANILVHRLHDQAQITALDLGSLWEPYIGCATRGYHGRVLDRERRRVAHA